MSARHIIITLIDNGQALVQVRVQALVPTGPQVEKSPPKKEKKKDFGLTLKSQVAKYHKVSMRCPKFFHPKPKYLREFMRGVHQVRV